MRLGFAIFALVLCGCDVFDPALLERDTGPADADTGPADTGSDTNADTDPPMECESRLPPANSGAADGDGDRVVLALRSPNLAQGADARTIGFDLDQLCPDSEPAQACRAPSGGPAAADGDDGIDNALGLQLAVILAGSGLNDLAGNSSLGGNGAILVIIDNWNGEANDSSVNVSISQSVYAAPATEDGEPPTLTRVPGNNSAEFDNGRTAAPCWEDTDYFWARTDTFSGDTPESEAEIQDPNAYVVDNSLVFALPPRTPINFTGPTNGVQVLLSDARVSIDVTDLEDVKMTVGARWKSTDLVDAVASVGICEGDPRFSILESLLDTNADVLTERQAGPVPAVLPMCTAVSMGVTFVGRRAELGGLADAVSLPNQCEDMPPAPDAGDMDAGDMDAGDMDAGTPDADGGAMLIFPEPTELFQHCDRVPPDFVRY